ncbi:MAG: hypothetical protein M3044_06245 [Thermoproteota archaeon]|nr:hypothetical protein [Thermoproteota archaeon]
MSRTSCYYFYSAATVIAIAGILHLVMASNVLSRGTNNTGIFFLACGIVQLFWVIPMIRRWGRSWYVAGIVGTIALIVLYGMTRIHNPITSRALSINYIGIGTEVFQIAFIIIAAIIIVRETRRAPQISQKEVTR